MPALFALVRAAALTAACAAPALSASAQTVAPKKPSQSPAQTSAPTSEHASKNQVKRVAKTAPAPRHPDSSPSHEPAATPKKAVQSSAQTSAQTAEHARVRVSKAHVTRAAKTSPGIVGDEGVKALVSLYAQRHGVPETLAHRIVIRESRYNPALKGGAHFGLMQISLPTAKQMGYAGAPQGLLDARTNLSYGMPYLANAWLVSGGSEARAVSLYSRGYYYDAKRKGVLKELRTARSAPVEAVEAEAGGGLQ